MILIVGAKASGKLTYAKSLGYSDEQIADAVLDDKPVLYNLQDIVRKNNIKPDELVEQVINKEVIICNEVGCGVIPLVEEETRFRESVGRLCVDLASKADRVVRLVCGLPVVMKG